MPTTMLALKIQVFIEVHKILHHVDGMPRQTFNLWIHRLSLSFSSAHPIHDVDLVGDVDVSADGCVGRLLEVQIVVVVVIVVVVDRVGYGDDRVKDGEHHPSKHQWNKSAHLGVLIVGKAWAVWKRS